MGWTVRLPFSLPAQAQLESASTPVQCHIPYLCFSVQVPPGKLGAIPTVYLVLPYAACGTMLRASMSDLAGERHTSCLHGTWNGSMYLRNCSFIHQPRARKLERLNCRHVLRTGSQEQSNLLWWQLASHFVYWSVLCELLYGQKHAFSVHL